WNWSSVGMAGSWRGQRPGRIRAGGIGATSVCETGGAGEPGDRGAEAGGGGTGPGAADPNRSAANPSAFGDAGGGNANLALAAVTPSEGVGEDRRLLTQVERI